MKKIYKMLWLLALLAVMPVANVVAQVAKIGSTEYATLEAAFAAATDGETVTLLADCAGNGIKVPQGKYNTKGLTVDFGGFTYTVNGNLVGSTGTESQAFQLLKDNTITFKNGTIYSEKALFLVQNYSNLTLDNMTLTLNNPNYASAYTLSNNNGNVVIDGTTINANPAGGFAFDVCRYASYPSVSVTVQGNSTINGNVEVSASGNSASEGLNLTLTSGEINGAIVVDPSATAAMAAAPEKASINKSAEFKVNVAQIGTDKYETLQAAVDAASAGDVIELLQDIDLTTVTTTPNNKYNVNVNKSVTIDGKGYKITSSEGKRALALTGEGNDITLKNLTVVNNKADWCMGILNALTCTLDAVTLNGTNGKTYNQPLTIGSISENGRVTLNVTNGSVIKTNDAGSAHYAILVAHPADITVTNSSLIGWANVYLKPDAAGSKVNISNSTLKSQGIAGPTNNFSMFTTECGNNTITLTDNNISLTPAADTYMTLVTLNGTANNTVKVEGDKTTFTTTDVTRGGISYRKGDFDGNTVTFDEDAHTAFAEAIDVLKNEGVSDTEAEGVYTLGYVTEVYYYWYVNDVEAGGNHDFAEPFKKGWLSNGEFIRLKKDVTLTENLTWANENASFTLTLGEYSVTKGEFSVALKKGVTVNTDKQTDIFTAANSAYTVKETAVEGGYTYAVVERSFVAQIGETKYETLEAAFAAATDGATITLLADCSGNGIVAPQGKFANGLTVDFAKHTYTVDGETVGSTGTETNGFQLLKDNKITFKNGTITSEKAKILVQNYSDLTLEGMTLTLNNANYTSAYTLSNNNGNVVIDGTTITANPAGGFAFDVCRYSSYSSVNVEVKGSSVINGNVEISATGSDAKDGFGLKLTSGTLNGNIVVDASAAAAMKATPEKATVTKAEGFDQAAPEGYEWKDNGNGTSTMVEKTSYTFTDGTDTYTITTEKKNVSATYKRDFTDRTNKFQGWLVPFDYTITDTDIEKFEFREISKVEFADENKTKMQMRLGQPLAAGTTLEANKPYVFVPTTDVAVYEFTATSTTLKVADADAVRATFTVDDNTVVSFYGVYTSAHSDGNSYIYYMGKSGNIGYSKKTGLTVGSFRWIFKIADGVGNSPSFAYTFGVAEDNNDDVTAVSSAAVEAEGEVVGYYTLSGQKVSEPTKGVYVVKYANGTSKKVVF